ncbi:MAG: trypsin-like serine protease [Bacilli bacterium]|nr:trypsin-like serine protease [Bacilli bacterium]
MRKHIARAVIEFLLVVGGVTGSDITQGQSGGACIYVDNNTQNAYARGIVSGIDANNEYNIITKVNKINYNLLTDLVAEVI